MWEDTEEGGYRGVVSSPVGGGLSSPGPPPAARSLNASLRRLLPRRERGRCRNRQDRVGGDGRGAILLPEAAYYPPDPLRRLAR